MYDVRLLAEISTVGAGFCRTRTTVPQSIWHFRSKNGYAIFHCYEYHLDSLRETSWALLVTCANVVVELNCERFAQGENNGRVCPNAVSFRRAGLDTRLTPGPVRAWSILVSVAFGLRAMSV